MKKIDKYLKCDFHLHSSSCFSRDYSFQDFKDKLKKSNLDVIAITDHNVIDIMLLNNLQNELRDKMNFIGGMELNLAIDDETIRKNNLVVNSDYFHAVVWFSTKDIEEFWENQKELITDIGINISGQTIKQISKETDGKFFLLSKFQEKFKNVNYFLTFHENKSDRNLSDYLPNHSKSNQRFKHNIFYYNNKYAVEGGQKSKKISDYFEENLDLLISRFYCSDAKKINEIGEKFTWILFDGNFESLILPMSDPTSRIFTSDQYKEYPQINYDNYLEEIKIFLKNNTNKEEKEVTINFSPGMNGIIGSRGSGKSLLGSVLADKDVLASYSDFINHDKTQYKICDKEYQFSKPKCKYLKQDGLLDLFRKGQLKDIDFLKDYYQTQEIAKKEVLEKFVKIAKSLLEFEKKKFNELIQTYQSTLIDLSFIENEVNEEYAIPIIETSLFQDNGAIINHFDETAKKISYHKTQIQELLSVMKLSDNDYSELIGYNDQIANFKNCILSELNQIDRIIINYKEIINQNENYNTNIRKELIKKYFSEVIKYNSAISSDTSNYIELKSNSIKQLSNILEFRSLSNCIYNKLSNMLLIAKSEIKSEPFSVNEKDIIEVSTTIEDNIEYKSYISEEIKFYESENHNKHLIKMFFDYNEVTSLKGIFNGNRYRGLSAGNEIIERFYSNVIANIQKTSVFDIKIYLNNKDLEKFSPGKKSEVLLDMFLEKSILKEDYIYIILDQPEDNMDTLTITKKLINRIRELKKSVQIFVISHSAAVIINGDAENLIYAYENDTSIDYMQGRIIDIEMKKHIVDILDGGEKNLKMRFSKYDFKLIEEAK